MSGFYQTESTSVDYISISDGRFVRKHKEPIEGVTTTRVNKMGNTVHEERFDAYKGLITKIEKVDHESFGTQWRIHLLAGDLSKAIVTVPYSSTYFKQLANQLLTIEHPLQTELVLKPWSMQDKKNPDKYVIGITVYQNGSTAPQNKAGKKYRSPLAEDDGRPALPSLVKVKIKGKDAWDDTDQLELLENDLMSHIGTGSASAPTGGASAPKNPDHMTGKERMEAGKNEVHDDVPF